MIRRRKPKSYKELEFEVQQLEVVYPTSVFGVSLSEMWMELYNLMEGKDA